MKNNAPKFITNFKLYPSAMGQSAVQLAKQIEAAQSKTNISLEIAVNAIDLQRVQSRSQLPVWAQHTDTATAGSFTGHISPELLALNNIKGSLLNHSELRLDTQLIESTLRLATQHNREIILCVESEDEVATYTTLINQLYNQLKPENPLFSLAYEPPELIGSSDKSVSSENPDIIKKSVQIAGDIPLLIGAGVNKADDLKIGLDLGAQGFLVASAITKAQDPTAAMLDLLDF